MRISNINWRPWAAGCLFLFGFVGLEAGVGLSERPNISDADWLAKAYYSIGLFVLGGLEIGVPESGPKWAQALLWFAYFGAPLLAASTLFEAILKVLMPDRWRLRRLRNHTVLFGSHQLTLSYLRMLKASNPRSKVVVVDSQFDPVREQEFRLKFGAQTVVGDLTHRYLLRQLMLKKTHRVLLLGDNDFQSFEAATRILDIAPELAGRIVLHCHNLRFMRSLENSAIAEKCSVFNEYHLAARGLVRGELVDHFARTQGRDTVVMAGFGRFGQSVLEELHAIAGKEIEQVAVIDKDADRRVLVVDEQEQIQSSYPRNVFQGDISHPQVWREVTEQIDLAHNAPTVMLGTGAEQDNLRTALWIKNKYPNAFVILRTSDKSHFATSVGGEHGIRNISIRQLVEENIPSSWLK